MKMVANDDATTNRQQEWHMWVAAGNKSAWGQRSDEGVGQ